ncbi:MAG: membrane protein insertion efficiency factor YidD [Selenomonadaceae bacterium]|nr:membrane protein insertion efficiency factor YidD [Selenomonadaceae bacterium]MBP3721929.1 membrane protein insertion efficiency factor YidD [Selenomonadaceae bacterium]
MKRFLLFVIKCYKNYISILTPPACRFYPSCSTYTYEAIEKYGALKGSFLGIKRILRCNPFGGSGYDPVP